MNNNVRIGIDLGGTKIECVVLENHQEFFRKRIATESAKGAEHIINQIKKIYGEALTYINNADHKLGICSPGSISQKTGLLRNSNTTCLNGLPLSQMLEDKLNHQLLIENDANCFALAEATLGAGQDYECVFGIIMGTGCGGGFVFNKRVRQGPNLISGEWGHSILHTDGLNCYCGKMGCVEKYISGGGIASILKENNINLSANEFFNKSDFNKNEKKIYEKFLDDFGQAVSNVINSFDPDVIILGGGLSNISALYSEGVDKIKLNTFSDSFKTRILPNQLGDSSGVIGAAML